MLLHLFRQRIQGIILITLILFSMNALSQEGKKKDTVVKPQQAAKVQSDSIFMRLQTGEKVYCLSPPDFWTKQGGHSDWLIYDGMLRNQATTMFTFTAPLHLPHNARVTRIVMVCRDNHRSHDVRLTLKFLGNTASERRPGDQNYSVGSVESNGVPRDWRLYSTTDLNNPVINYLAGAYWMELNLPGYCAFRSAKIFYKTD